MEFDMNCFSGKKTFHLIPGKTSKDIGTSNSVAYLLSFQILILVPKYRLGSQTTSIRLGHSLISDVISEHFQISDVINEQAGAELG